MVGAGHASEANGNAHGNGHGETAIGPDYESRSISEGNGHAGGHGTSSQPENRDDGNGHGHYPGATLG
jgi:hypothetical protein